MDNTKKRILMLCWEFPPNIVGGLSRHVYGLSVQLAELGYEVHVLTAGNATTTSFENIRNVLIHRIQPLNELDEQFLSWIGGLNLAMALKAEELIAENQFHIIHAHDWLVGAAAIALNESLSIPLIATIHATEHGRNNGIYTEMQKFIHHQEQLLINAANQIIVCSEYMKEEINTVFQKMEEKITVIPNGFEPLKGNLAPHEVLPNLKNKKYIFSIGRIVKEKGFDTIIEAAAIAKENEKDIYFVIAGKGPMLESYRRQVIGKKLEEYVVFVGFITDEVRNTLILNSEMAVIPSLYEPFGIVALETMNLEKPTIVSETGGLKGIVKHLHSGLLMNPGDAKSLLEQVFYLRQNPEQAIAIGKKGKQIINSLYGWKRIAAETSRLIEDTYLSQKVNEKNVFSESPNII